MHMMMQLLSRGGIWQRLLFAPEETFEGSELEIIRSCRRDGIGQPCLVTMEPFEPISLLEDYRCHASIVGRFRGHRVSLPLLIGCKDMVAKSPADFDVTDGNSEFRIACVGSAGGR